MRPRGRRSSSRRLKGLYTPDEALYALHAAVGGEEEPLLARFLEAGTTEGLPGLCRACAGRSWGAAPAGVNPLSRIRGRIRHLEHETAADVITVRHPDGSASRFGPDAFMECFLHESERGHRDHFGEEAGPAHPLTVALRTATNLEDLQRVHGTMMGFFVGEDEIIRGTRQRPGPSVEWDGDGTTCS